MSISAVSQSGLYPPGYSHGNTPFSGIQPSVSGPEELPAVQNTEATGQQETSQTQNEEQTNPAQQSEKMVNGNLLDQSEMRVLEELKQRDAEVRRHEMAHIAAGGRYIKSGATFSYQRGPDGRNYAVGGEVSIDTSPVPGDPQATVQKMRQVKRSALAPANPSAQDLSVAANASAQATKALSELMVMQATERAEKNEKTAFGDVKAAADSYQKVTDLPETETKSFEIAV